MKKQKIKKRMNDKEFVNIFFFNALADDKNIKFCAVILLDNFLTRLIKKNITSQYSHYILF